MDFNNSDYNLQSTSPCIDAGDPVSPLDPDGTLVEMGACFFPQFIISDFAVDTTIGYVPLTVNFTDLSTPGTGVIDEWYWDFGDGNNSSSQNPTHEYPLLGYYTVSLTVTNDLDSTSMETKVDYIKVTPPAYDGTVWHVSTTGWDAFGNGSIQYPFATIQHGINTSSNTDTVLVQPGTYVENINYNGKLITIGSLFLTTQDTSYISQTIIDGDTLGSVITFENSEDSTAVLCGLTITNGLNEYGGGIFCSYSSPGLKYLSITNNLAKYGCGIYFYNSSPSLQNVTISGNSASGIEGFGGGIYCTYSSNPSLQNVTISGNSAVYGGGIYCSGNSNPILQNVTISGNTAYVDGGGIYCENYSSPNLYNVTISGNSSQIGGGIYCYGSGSNPSLINSIMWNDSPEEIYIVQGSVITATYSDIEGGWAGTGNIDSAPLFVNPGNGDYHLQPGSPCIDAGDPASPLDPDSTIVDMGAYYFHQIIPPDPPQNITIEIIGTDVHISWDVVTGANSYKVYSSDDPYTGFIEETSGSFAGESWSTSIMEVKKFYYVKASTETTRSKYSDSQDAYQPDRKSRRYDLDKFINRKRK